MAWTISFPAEIYSKKWYKQKNELLINGYIFNGFCRYGQLKEIIISFTFLVWIGVFVAIFILDDLISLHEIILIDHFNNYVFFVLQAVADADGPMVEEAIA